MAFALMKKIIPFLRYLIPITKGHLKIQENPEFFLNKDHHCDYSILGD